MKKIIISLAIVITSCSTVEVREGNNRVIGKEYNVYQGQVYRIIEIDGVEYISTTNGGICPLIKKDSNK